MHKLLKLFLVGIGFLLLVVCYVVLIGVEVNSKYINDKITNELGNSLGRHVSVDGPVVVRVSMMPSVSLHGLHIQNPEGFSSQDDAEFLYLKEAYLALNLWGLFKNQVIVQRVSGAGLSIALLEKDNGKNNWTFKASPEDPQGLADVLELLERSAINDVDFKQLKLTFKRPGQQTRFFNLDLMEASIPSRKNIKIELSGKVEQTFPYHFVINADSLTTLASEIKTVTSASSGEQIKNTNHSGWTYQAKLEFLDSQSNSQGTLKDNEGRLSLKVTTPNLEKFGKILDTSLPNFGQTIINADLLVTQDFIEMDKFKATFANTEINGALSLKLADKPSVKGNIYLPVLDVSPFLAHSKNAADETSTINPPTNFMQVYKQLLNNDFDLNALQSFNADIDLKLDQLKGLPTEVKNGELKLKIHDGRLIAPMTLSMAGVDLKGQLDAHSKKQSSQVNLHLWAKNQNIADLGQALTGVQGMKGNLGVFDVNLHVQGQKLGEAFEHLSLTTKLENSRLSYGNIEGGKPVDFSVEQFNFSIQPHQPIAANFVGSLLNQPVKLSLSGDALSDIVKTELGHYQLNAYSKSASVNVQATSSIVANEPKLEAQFKVNALNANDLSNWLGLQSTQAKAFALEGALHANAQQWGLDHLMMKLGRSDLSLSAQRKNLDKKPFLAVDIHSNNIDYSEIKSILPAPEKKDAATKPTQEKLSFNIPVLPQGVDLSDANINIALSQINGVALPVKHVAFNLKIKDGFIGMSPFSVDVNEIHNHGAIYLDLRSADPVIKLWFASNQASLGPILQQLKLSQNIDASFEQFTLYLESHSSLLGDLIGQAKILGDLSNGSISIRDPQTKKAALVRIATGGITAGPNEKITLKLTGTINDSAIDIKVDTGTAKELMDVSKRIPFELNTKVANTQLTLAGSLSRKMDDADVDLRLKISGKSLSDLNQILDVDIPPWGPWSLSGLFKMTDKSYEVSDFDLTVGESILKGKGALLTDLKPVKLDINLNAHQIQLDDFRMERWAKSKGDKQSAESKSHQTAVDTHSLSQKVEQFLNPNFMQSANVVFKARVDQVLSRNEKLGQGAFDFTLNNGLATIGPVSVETDKGKALWWLKYQPREKDIQLDFHADVDRFDYGAIARHMQANSDVKGKFSLKVDVSSRAPHLSDLWKYAGGDLEFALSPENQKSGVLDLWAVNVLTGLLPVVDPSKESKINCAIGQFHLENGVVREKLLQIDTSGMRVNGVFYADLKTQQLFAKVRPQAKKAQFLSLATPIEVTGTFDKFNIGPSLFDVAETMLRIGTSVVWVPLKKLFGDNMQADGADICPAF
jgi:uncharacterized protein involved in outer membrane biogenesis